MKITDNAELRRVINTLNPWFCPAVISGMKVQCGIGSDWSDRRLASRYEYREPILVDEIVKRVSVVGKTILDVGCNCGYWSARYAEKGANKIVGFDGRPFFIEQAYLYYDNNNFLEPGAYTFLTGDVAQQASYKFLARYKPIHGCICAGILYHVPNYREVLAWIADLVSEFIVIDTRVVYDTEKIIVEEKDAYFNAIGDRKKVTPNYNELTKHLDNIGFRAEKIQTPNPVPIGLEGPDDYKVGNRVTILAVRK